MNNIEENDPFRIDHISTNKRCSVKKSRLTRKKNDTHRNSKRFQNNINKRFQNDEANNANKIRTEDLKIKKIQASYIREIKLTLRQNVHWNR